MNVPGDETREGLGRSRAGLGAPGPLWAVAVVPLERWMVSDWGKDI